MTPGMTSEVVVVVSEGVVDVVVEFVVLIVVVLELDGDEDVVEEVELGLVVVVLV